MLQNINAFLSARSQTQLMVISFVLIAIVGAIDYFTGYELSFSLFYLLPVSVSAWHLGKYLGIFISIISAATWLAIDYTSGKQYSHIAIPFWNAGIRLGFFVIVAQLLWRLRTLLEYESSLAQIDGLTGILNNRSFKQRCYSLTNLAVRNSRSIVLGYLDLDGFKMVNDSLGHAGGDEVLKAVAATLSKRLRKSDLVGRMGGDEFAILLPETDLSNAKILFADIHKSLMELAVKNRWAVGFSIGVAVFHSPPEDPEDIIRYADDLMYKVKNIGKNSILIEEYFGAYHDVS